MSSSEECGSPSSTTTQKKYNGIRRRKWGKWVSEIRVPGTRDRLWLGSYSTPEAAAVAHDVATYCLRGQSSTEKLNFPTMLPARIGTDMSPTSIQKAASDAGMAVDAQLIVKQMENDENKVSESGTSCIGVERENWSVMDDNCGIWDGNGLIEGEDLNISIEDYL